MDPQTVGLIGIVVLFCLLLLGMPIGFSLAFVGFWGISFLTDISVALPAMVRSFFGTFTTYSFTVIPLFVIMGELATVSGLSRGIYDVADKWLRRLPGGLAIATIGACSGFAAICGSSVATAATLGRVALPEMKKYNYDIHLATGSVAAGGTLGFLIPPSIGFVVYGILTEQSIGKLLISGVVPGFLLALTYVAIIVVWVGVSPAAAPKNSQGVLFRDKMASLLKVWELIVVFFLVMGGIYLGMFTPTEAGALGAFFLFVVTLLRRKLTWKSLVTAMTTTTKVSVMIFMILAGAYVFTYFMALTMIPMDLSVWLSNISLSRYLILTIILLIYLLLGCFLDATAMMVLTLPVIFPTIVALGFNPIWFGVISVLMMEAGLITPPLGLNIFVIAGVADVPMEVVFKGTVPFLLAIAVVVTLVTVFPPIALFLSGIMG
ncbi:TRAP transporter, DctM subunit [Desulfocicer vacuolatum DSM 3385]|uniref:TRAP transporter, DctM subunit n=1 Tax=Desulfocicer vacuolatum DSM 3385 TaxID=1121400 RepID=A0A1W2CQM2_9BACT|nr:TRAP transporter large permease [Desulfocicer vacuolatum]SMC87254.1 TRAP transporter, DctM subunit [Desulfocicer vacuolatum DSM 3385]